MGTVVQQKWIIKLLGYDFKIPYKKEKENVVVDVLSKRHECVEEIEGFLALISFPNPNWLEELKGSYG